MVFLSKSKERSRCSSSKSSVCLLFKKVSRIIRLWKKLKICLLRWLSV